jgi:hypothetical protein
MSRRTVSVALQLEPRPTGQIVVRAETDLIEQIDRVALQYRATRSKVTRALIRQGLQALQQQEG